MSVFKTRVCIALVISMFAVACSDGTDQEPPDAGAQSDAGSSGGGETRAEEPMRAGSRLALRLDRAEGGAVHHRGFYDTQLAANCTFRRVGETAPQYRCLAVTSYVAFAYRDAACTDRVALVRSRPTRPEPGDLVFATERTWRGCHGDWAVFLLGAETTPAQLFHLDSSGGCQPATPNAGERVHEVSEGSTDAFVAGSERVVTFPTGLEAVYVDGEDGSSAFDSLREAGQACTLEMLGEIHVCGRDFASTFGHHHAEEGCGGAAVAPAYDYGSTCGATASPPRRILRFKLDPNGCPGYDGLFAVGPSHATAWDSSQGCVESSASNATWYELGEPLSPASLPQLKSVEVGSGRLRSRYQAAMDGTLLSPLNRWRDDTLGFECTPALTTGGEVRCLPNSVGSQERFADAACSKLIVGRYSITCDGPIPEEALVRVTVDSEDRVTSVHALEPWSGPQHESDGSGGCAEVQPIPDYDYYRVADERPIDHFALIERIEPGAR